MDSHDPVDELLRAAAPGRAPPGFADSVVASVRRARRRGRARLALAAAAAIAVALGVWSATRPGPRGRPEPRVVVGQRAAPRGADDSAAELAVALPHRPRAGRRVMMGRVNGRVAVVEGRRDAAPPRRAGRSMAGFVGEDLGGPSFAVLFR